MLAWFILVSSVFLADSGLDRAELAQFQGKWQVVRQEHGGKKSDAKAIAGLTMEVAEVKMTVRDGVDIKEESKIVKLSGKRPHGVLDLKITAGTDLDKVIQGIWKREGDLLTVCIAEPGKDRPTRFAAPEGTGHTLLVFKRSK